MLRDAEHFNSRIGNLDGAGDTGDFLIKLVKEKPITNASKLTAAPTTNGKTSSESKRSTTEGKEEGRKSEGKDSDRAS